MPYLYLLLPQDFPPQDYPWGNSRAFVYSLLPKEVPYLMSRSEWGITDQSKIHVYDRQGNPYEMLSYSTNKWSFLPLMLLKGYSGGLHPHNLYYHLSLVSPPTLSIVYPHYEGNLNDLAARIPLFSHRIAFLESIYPQLIANLAQWFSQGVYPVISINSIVYTSKRINATGELLTPADYRYLLTGWEKVYYGPRLPPEEELESSNFPTKSKFLRRLGEVLYQFATSNVSVKKTAEAVFQPVYLEDNAVWKDILRLARGEKELEPLQGTNRLYLSLPKPINYCEWKDFAAITRNSDNVLSDFLLYLQPLIPSNFTTIDFIVVVDVLCRLLNRNIYPRLTEEYSFLTKSFSRDKDYSSPMNLFRDIVLTIISMVGILQHRDSFYDIPFEGSLLLLAQLDFLLYHHRLSLLLFEDPITDFNDLIRRTINFFGTKQRKFFTDPIESFEKVLAEVPLGLPLPPFTPSAFSIY